MEQNEKEAIGEEGAGTVPEEEAKSLQEKLAEASSRAESYLANWQRAQADFINYRRRAEQEKEDSVKFANAMLILNILPVLDDLERALTSVSRDLAGLTWVDGIHLIYRKLQAVLENAGLSEIKAAGEKFDPNHHEAIMYGEGEEGVVISEVQKGYRLYDRVIRPSMVIVGKGREKSEETGAGKAPEGGGG